jgi:pyrroline-5-carboxylate reductase
MVCSPKGTTIEGLKVLERQKAFEAFKEAVKAAAKRAKELSR